ncbi:hypothetical protein LPJ70_003620 [Coemansia sp. RSA 2708]|nr:hypothetical protein LPJ70_003620 [Coemansia sp. RSA 2708]
MELGLARTVFNLKFTAKSLKKESARLKKQSAGDEKKVKASIKDGDVESARIHASNAIRKKNTSLDLLRLSSRVDAAVSRIDMAVKMQHVTGSMARVVSDMDRALRKNMNLDAVSQIMDKFESQSENLDLHAKYMEGSMNTTTTLSTPQTEVDSLMQRVADEAGLELSQELGVMQAPQEPLPEDTRLNERLANLRNAL